MDRNKCAPAGERGAEELRTSPDCATNHTPRPFPIHYSRGRDKFDAYPEQRPAVSFAAFAEAVLSDRSTAKGLTWISASFRPNSDGRHHRCREGALPRRFLAFDLDGATPDAFAELCMLLGAYSGFGYTTASHTAESPHARYILELSRAVDRGEGIRLGEAMQRQIEGRLGSRVVKLDPSVYRAEQPVFAPLMGAETMRYHGDPIDVDQVLKNAPPSKERPGRVERAAAIASRDPVVQALADRGMIKRDHGDGKLSIVCPFEDSHTEPDSETSTVYFLPNFGGVPYGKFVCMHSHCRGRDQPDHLRGLGLNPKQIWKEQANGTAPYDDLPPVASYDEAAQDHARRPLAGPSRHTEAPAGGEPRPDNGASPGQSAGATTGVTGAPTFISAAALWDMQHAPTRWAVPGILPEGVALLGGKPKTGKSWLALDLAIAVGTGGRALGAIEVEPGPVLYLALEDTKRRLTKRLRILCGDTKPPPQQIEFLADCPRLGSGGDEVLRAWLRDHPTARLVVIDTLPRFRPPTKVKETPYANDYAVGEYLSRLCVEFQVSILLLGHLRKQPGDDPIDEISGTLGLVGSVDGYMVLRRQSMSDEATLYVCGRDVDEPAEHCLSWDRPLARWRITGADPRVPRLPAEQRRVYELLSKTAKNTKELTEALNPGYVVTDLRSDQKYKNVAKLVYKLRDRDLVFQRPFDKRWAPSTQRERTGSTGGTRGTGRTGGTQNGKCSPSSFLAIRARGNTNQAMTPVLGVVPPYSLCSLEIPPPPIDGEVLRYPRTRDALTADLLNQLKAHKAGIVAALAQPALSSVSPEFAARSVRRGPRGRGLLGPDWGRSNTPRRAAGVVVEPKVIAYPTRGRKMLLRSYCPCIKAHKPELLRLLQPRLMTLLRVACEGTDLSPDTFRSLLSPVETLHAYALSFAEGIRSGRVVPIRDDTATAPSAPP